MNNNNLDIIVSISEIVLYFSLVILSVYLIITLKKLMISIVQIKNEVVEISDQLSPIISDMKLITEDVKTIIDRSRIQFDNIENVSESFVQKGVSILNTINKIENLSNGFMLNTSNLIFAISRGVKTFGNKLKNGSVKQVEK